MISRFRSVMCRMYAARLSWPSRKIRARSHHNVQFSTTTFSTWLFGVFRSRPFIATQSSSLRMKQSVISTSCELHGLIPSSFCTREPHSFTFRTVTLRLARGTIVQCEEPPDGDPTHFHIRSRDGHGEIGWPLA